MNQYISERTYRNEDFTDGFPELLEFVNCIFDRCNFTHANLGGKMFQECIFRQCDLSLMKVNNTAFQEVCFESCKLIGVHFEDCNRFLLSMHFEECILNLASFYQIDLKKSRFSKCIIHEVDFTGADLSGLILDNCDFFGTVFENTNLKKCDFRTAVNYSIDPGVNRITKAAFSISGIKGLLDKYDLIID